MEEVEDFQESGPTIDWTNPSLFSKFPPSEDTIQEVEDPPSTPCFHFPKKFKKAHLLPRFNAPSNLPPLRSFGDNGFLSPIFQHKGVEHNSFLFVLIHFPQWLKSQSEK